MKNGWTETEARSRVSLRKMQQNVFAKNNAEEYVVFDAEWGEWAIVSRYPGTPTTIERKSRRGLPRSKSYRVFTTDEELGAARDRSHKALQAVLKP